MRIPDDIPGPRTWAPPPEPSDEPPLGYSTIPPKQFAWESPALTETRLAVTQAHAAHQAIVDQYRDDKESRLRWLVGLRGRRIRIEARLKVTESALAYYELAALYLNEAKAEAKEWDRFDRDALNNATSLVATMKKEADKVRGMVESFRGAGS